MTADSLLNEVRAFAGAFVSQLGLGEIVAARRLTGGANNQVYRLECRRESPGNENLIASPKASESPSPHPSPPLEERVPDLSAEARRAVVEGRVKGIPEPTLRTVVLKRYFRSAGDSRDRFGHERAFYSYAHAVGVRRIPDAFGWDDGASLGALEWLDGSPLQPDDVSDDEVKAALEFFQELNAGRDHEIARIIEPGSEACFTVADHLDCLGRRVERLMLAGSKQGADAGFRALVDGELVPAWENVRKGISAQLLNLDEPLAEGNRCLSPSDFGFHNCLCASDGSLRFFDFEYSGWDDPAKTMGDFFSQPRIPVPLKYWDYFLEVLKPLVIDFDMLRHRAQFLFPAYQLKWVCIMLNEFMTDDLARREFSDQRPVTRERREEQLARARFALHNRTSIDG